MYSSILKSDGDIIITQANISDTFFSNVDMALTRDIRKINGVKDISAVIVGASPVDNLPIVAIYGVSKNRYKNYKLIQGTYPKKDEAMIGKGIYDKLSWKDRVNISGKTFDISGIFKSDIGFKNGGVVLNIKDEQRYRCKDKNYVKLKGSFSIKMTDFNITPPKLLFLTVRDRVDIKYSLEFTK